MNILKYALVQLVRIAPIPFVFFAAIAAFGALEGLALGRSDSNAVSQLVTGTVIVVVWLFLYTKLKPLAEKYSPKSSKRKD